MTVLMGVSPEKRMTIVKKHRPPDELRQMPHGNGQGAIVSVGAMTVVRRELQPSWRWSNDLRPMVGTASCKFGHARILLEAVSASRWTTAARSTSARATSRTSTRPRRLGVGDQVVRAIDWATTSFIEEYAKPLPVSASS